MINCVRDTLDLLYRLENLPSLWRIYNTRNLKKLFHTQDTFNEICSKYIERAKEKLREMTNNIDPQNHSILEKLLHIDEKTAHVMAQDMIMGGIDTIGNAAGGLLYYIANNPEKQDKLREELDVIACHALISMKSAQFTLPHKYIPERWLRDNTKFRLNKKAHPYACMPFGYGARTCIGRRFAEMELEILLLTIIRNFRIEWHHGPLEYKSQITSTLTLSLRLKLIDL
ncbi:probable cytochrome P450 12b2, mitochondrial isoform X2 [Cataglyphis hispanica]|uniref:probable cytochrome P450 12b2, mitochondrial isoform X2 n=1 Tax=Cataglyphis hispanica TaxID=1086592 RepID=UPI00217F7C8B|nr:probable cytochrome P450 12b2, mitochondrial isoform X2 [Cataglyphis hispanica]